MQRRDTLQTLYDVDDVPFTSRRSICSKATSQERLETTSGEQRPACRHVWLLSIGVGQ